MPPNQTARENPFRVEADKLRSKLGDLSQKLTVEEVNTLADEIRALDSRAAAVAGFTPADEIARRPELADVLGEGIRADVVDGSDLRIESDAGSRDGRTRIVGGGDDTVIKPEYRPRYVRQLDRARGLVEDAFGGPGNYLLALAQTRGGARTFTDRERAVHEAVQAWHLRTIIGAANDASGGEFLLPLEQVPSIFQVPNIQPGILQIARRYPASGRTLRIPYVVQTDATKTRPMAGIANITWVDEAGDKPVKEPAFKQRLLTVYKAAAYAEIADETLMDDFTGMLPSTLQTLVGGQVMNFMNEQFTIDGTGSSAPTAALYTSSPSLLKVPRKTASQINIEDVVAMYSQFTHIGSRASQRWLIHRTALPQLLQLKLSGNTLVTFLSNLRDEPVMQLFGIPVEVCDLLNTLGSESDFALVNGEFYAYAVRQQLTVESSIHYKFKNDITAYRFHARGGGIPIPDGTYAYKSPSGTKVGEHSPFVTLDDVIAS